MHGRRRRSRLVTPASSERMITKAAQAGADIVCLDLEDAVAPAQRAAARAKIAAALTGLDWGPTAKAVRINAVQTPWAHGDVIDVITRAQSAVDLIVIPKVTAPRDVWWVDTLLTQLEELHGLPKPIGLEAIIEDAGGLSTVDAIAAASPRLEALVFGAGDLAASQHAQVDANLAPIDDVDIDLWSYARNRILLAARSAGIEATDAAYPDYHDLDGYRRAAVRASVQGYDGKTAIHPGQVPIANEAFTPSQTEIDRARRTLDLYSAETTRGRGALGVQGVMVDAAHVRLAHNVLARAGEL